MRTPLYRCHAGTQLYAGEPCSICGADEHGVCGRLYEAGYRDGFDKAVSLLAEGDETKWVALWLTTVRPPEAGASLTHADNTPKGR